MQLTKDSSILLKNLLSTANTACLMLGLLFYNTHPPHVPLLNSFIYLMI